VCEFRLATGCCGVATDLLNKIRLTATVGALWSDSVQGFPGGTKDGCTVDGESTWRV